MGHAYGTCTLIEIYSLMNLVQDFQNIYMNKHLILMRLFKIIKMQSNSRSIVHSLHVQIQNFRPYEHLNDVYLCS